MMKRIRTKQEIIKRLRERVNMDLFAFEWPEYLKAMKKEEVEELKGDLIKADADLEDWHASLYTKEQILESCEEYMPFAWNKANNCRGISSQRSIYHYTAWLWLLGEDGFDGLLDEYEYYGKPQLVKICEYLELDHTQWDNGVRSNTEY